MRWRPIETAPKDGTPVLVFYRGEMHVASYSPIWHPDNLRWCVAEPMTRPNEMYTNRCVHDIDIQCMDGQPLPGSEGPTHWMPLPAPPLASTEAVNG